VLGRIAVLPQVEPNTNTLPARSLTQTKANKDETDEAAT